MINSQHSRMFWIALLLLACLPCVAVAQDFTSNLVAHWTLNEASGSTTATDSSGNGHTGTLTNMDVNTVWVPGKIAGALDCDGTNDFVDVADHATLDLTEAITIAAWIFPQGALGTKELGIVSKSQGGVGPGIAWSLIIVPTSKPRLELHTGAFVNIVGATTITVNTWYHVVGTYDRTNLRLYVNGIADATPVAHTNAMSINASDLLLCDHVGDVNRYFHGLIDDIRIYSRALSGADITALHAWTGAAARRRLWGLD